MLALSVFPVVRPSADGLEVWLFVTVDFSLVCAGLSVGVTVVVVLWGLTGLVCDVFAADTTLGGAFAFT
jgi:hypothetical protein